MDRRHFGWKQKTLGATGQTKGRMGDGFDIRIEVAMSSLRARSKATQI